ncbi:fluoride efflux transporter CrcB [Flavobacteriaceae bacterium]|nr:fluoride efflux transporter CrcB [Flavobacteriaceae bacterium]
MKILIWVFIGGGLGSSFRYLLHLLFKNFNSQYPLATFSANLIGCLLIGLFFGILQKLNLLKGDAHFFFIVGFTGGLTTFSSFVLDNLLLFRESSILQPLLYSTGSVILGILMVVIGLWISKLI